MRLRSVSLDPDEDKRDTTIFDGLKNFMLNEMNDAECQHYKTVTLRNLAKRAQTLKQYRPPRGISFSLQQQREFNYFNCISNEAEPRSVSLKRQFVQFCCSFFIFFKIFVYF